MKKSLFYLFAIALLFGACNKDDEETTPEAQKPGEITLTVTQNGNVVTYKAVASDAISYIWDLGNGETPTGAEVTGTYSFPGDYEIKCTAKGRSEDRIKTEVVAVLEGDPEIFNEMNVTLAGYNAATGTSDAVWHWNNISHSNAVGPFPYNAETDSAYFAVVDDSWWGNDEGTIVPDALDDEYNFALNQSMTYTNDFKAAFIVSWAWMAAYYNTTVAIWSDPPYDAYDAPAASWSIRHIENISDSLSFTTMLNGAEMPGAYIIELTNGADLGMEAGKNSFQIISLDDNDLWVRFDSSPPENLYDIYGNPADLEAMGINAMQKEWRYMRFTRSAK